jgi:hypothetical protein
MQELVDRVNSRDTALAFCQQVLDRMAAERLRSDEIPKIEILPEENLSPDEYAHYLDARKKAELSGKSLIIFRADGVISYFQLELFPSSYPASQVRRYLTPEDVAGFQAKVITRCSKKSRPNSINSMLLRDAGLQ